MTTHPLRTLTIALIIFFSVVGIGYEVLYGYFSSNVVINGIVVSTMVFGLTYIYTANIRLQRTVNLFKQTEKLVATQDEEDDEDEYDDLRGDDDDPEYDYAEEYRDLMEKKGHRLSWLMAKKDVEVIKNWSPQNMFSRDQVESALNGTRLRIGEVKNFSNYFSGILIILGLLGTFLGLLETIKAIGLVFSGDSIKFLVADKDDTSAEDILLFFEAIALPLQGMGIAFSSSLFGLSGSLIVGMFAFVSSRNQVFFLFDFFDWLKSRTSESEAQELDRSVMTALPSSQGLMGALVRGGMKLPSGQTTRSVGSGGGLSTAAIHTGVGDGYGGGIGGEFRGKFKGEFRGDGDITGTLNADSLSAVLLRLESLTRDAVEKNGLLAKAALKLGENLALEQKRLADIATYDQQMSISLSAIRQQGDQQIHILNQMVEAQYNTTDKEEFRALAAHFHRSFETLLSDVNKQHVNLSEKMSRVGLAGTAPNLDPHKEDVSRVAQNFNDNLPPNRSIGNNPVASVKGNPVNPLAPSNDESNL